MKLRDSRDKYYIGGGKWEVYPSFTKNFTRKEKSCNLNHRIFKLE